MSTDIAEVIVTAGNPEWLVELSHSLIEERVCACAHHLTPIRSVYRWGGAIQDDGEGRVALHTRSALVPQLIARIKRVHPYEVPCILALPIADADPDYVRWVHAETSTGDQGTPSRTTFDG